MSAAFAVPVVHDVPIVDEIVNVTDEKTDKEVIAPPENRVVVPELPPTDPDAWIDVVERIIRGRVEPLDAWRLEIVPRLGVPYPYLSDKEYSIPQRMEIASRIAALGHTIKRRIEPQPQMYEFKRILEMMVTCNDRWHATDIIAQRIDKFLIRYKPVCRR